MQIRLAAVALFLCVPIAALAAEEAAPSPAPSEAAAQPEKPRKICRLETGTGSVRPRRVCRTVEQVAPDAATAQRTREAVNQGRSAP